jgi:hypothetical protein
MSLYGRAYVELVGTIAIVTTLCLLVGHEILTAQLQQAQQVPPDPNLGGPIFTMVQLVLFVLVTVLVWVALWLGQSVLGRTGGSR